MKQPKYTIRLLQAAEEDFKEIITYIAIDNTSAAEAIADKIENSLSNLSSYEGHTIWVHRIIHGARDYLSLL